MDMTNNLGDETGPESMDSQDAFKSLLDSETATIQEVETDAELEADNVSDTSEDDFDGDEEQSPEDSNGLADEADDAEAEEETEVAAIELADDALVNVNGEQVTGRELKDRGLRWADYTRKMQELGEHRKKWMTQEVEFHQIRGQFGDELNRLAHHVAQVFQMDDFGAEPDWAAEWDIDPNEAGRKKFQWDKDKAAWQQRQAAREAAVKAIYDHQVEVDRQNAVFANNKRENDIIESRETLARNLPDVFGDPQKANVNLLAVAEYLQSRGYPPEYIQNITDARMIEDAYYAKLGREASKKIQKAVAKIEAKPALTMPGTASSKSNATGFDAKFRDVRKGKASSADLFRELLKQ